MKHTICTLLALAALVAGSFARTNGPAATSTLNEIRVTAERTKSLLFDVPGGIAVIKREDVEASGAMALDRVFRGAAGVELLGGGVPGAPAKLAMRGMTTGYQSKRVLALVDGRRVNDPFQGNAELALYAADNIQRVEILRGPVSALYGSSAMGGIINIITRRGTARPYSSVNFSAGSYNTRRALLRHGHKIGGADYFVTLGRVATDGYLNNSDGSDRDWRADNLTANAGVQIRPDSELRIYGGVYDAEGADENSQRKVERDYQMADFKTTWNRNMRADLLFRVYRNGQRDQFDWTYPGVGIYRQETIAWEIQQSISPNASHTVTAGIESRDEGADITDVQGDIDRDEATVGCYAQDRIALSGQLYFTAGIRNDYNSGYGDELSPRVSLLWKAGSDTALFGSVARAHRAPALSDRYVNTEFNGALFKGNPDLEPESLDAWELGIRNRPSSFAYFELVLFRNQLRDTFDFMREPDGVFRIRNITRSRSQGAEAAVELLLGGGFGLAANYTFTDGEYLESAPDLDISGNQLAYLAKHKGALRLEYNRMDSCKYSAGLRYADDRYGDARNSAENKMGDALVCDIQGIVPITPHTSLSLNIDNLFDKDYRENPAFPQPGRSVFAGVEMVF